jgi:hypothetical protein
MDSRTVPGSSESFLHQQLTTTEPQWSPNLPLTYRLELSWVELSWVELSWVILRPTVSRPVCLGIKPLTYPIYNVSTRTAQKTLVLCCSAIVAVEIYLFVDPLLSEGCRIVAYFAVLTYQRVCMPQYYPHLLRGPPSDFFPLDNN